MLKSIKESKEIQSIAQQQLELPRLLFFLTLESQGPDKEFRTRLRESVAQHLKAHTDLAQEDAESLKDLGSPPLLKNFYLSISHCRRSGGWTLNPKPDCVGFDIEETVRIAAPLVQRMSSPRELERAPNPALLWVAKEAALKCLSLPLPEHQRPLLSQVEILQWTSVDKNWWSFQASLQGHLPQVQGLSGSWGPFHISFSKNSS